MTVVTTLIGDIALAVTFSTLLGTLARRIGQPVVVGQMLTGVLFGPSALGHLTSHLFPSSVLPSLSVLANVAVVIFPGVIPLSSPNGSGLPRRARCSAGADRLAEAVADGRVERCLGDGRADRGLLVPFGLGSAGAAVRLAPGDRHLGARDGVRGVEHGEGEHLAVLVDVPGVAGKADERPRGAVLFRVPEPRAGHCPVRGPASIMILLNNDRQ